MTLTVFDIIGLTIIGFFAFNGFRKGLVMEAVKILGVLIGLGMAIQYNVSASAFVRSLLNMSPAVGKAAGFVFVFIITIIIFIFIGRVVKRIVKMAMLGLVDRIGGMTIGGAKGALIVSAFLPLMLVLPDSIEFVKDAKRHSFIYKGLQGFAPMVYGSMSSFFPGTKNFTKNFTKSLKSKNFPGQSSKKPGLLDIKGQVENFMGDESSGSIQEALKQLEGAGLMDNIKKTDLKNLSKEDPEEYLKRFQKKKK